MKEIRELVYKRILHAQKVQKRQINIYHRDVEYAVGLTALLSTRYLRLKLPRKLQDWYIGQFKVLKLVGPTDYKLDLSHNDGLRTIHKAFHVSLLRDFEDNRLGQQPPPVEVYGLSEYEIEAIVGHWIYRKQPKYYVSFVGYDASENAWLAEKQLSNAKQLLSEYHLVHGL